MREKVSTHKLASCLDEGEVPQVEFLDVQVPNCLTVCRTGQKMCCAFARGHDLSFMPRKAKRKASHPPTTTQKL